MLCSTQGASKSTGTNCNGTNVKVVVRVRPQNEKEKEKQDRNVVNIVSEQVLVFDSADDIREFNGQKSTFVRGDITRRRYKNLNFAFDYVFGPDSLNVDVYEHTSKSILDGLLNGYNCSVFAYGATGAGKTYTMLGSNNQPGITFLTLMDLYQRIKAIKSEKVCEVAVSYLEIYNEQIKDLLNGRKQLPIREDPKSGVIVPGLSLYKPENEQDFLQMLYYGNQNRTQHPTDANAESSRSHAVFQVYVKQFERTANLVTSVHMAKLCLVDLAGSERGSVTKNNSNRMREGANINRSLLALGNVINMLADNKVKAHIPYRDSKLTRLLKDSIGGNCRTVMIAAISPSASSYDDTYNTLKYADRAKHIRADLKKNVMSVKSHISKYGMIIENLREQVSELKLKLQNFENNETAQKVNIPQLQSIEESKRLQEVLYNIFEARKRDRKEIFEYESILRMTEWKIFSKEQSLNKVGWVYGWDSLEYQSKKENGKRMMEISQKRIKSIKSKIESSQKNFLSNEEQLQRWKAEKNLTEEEMPKQFLDANLRAHHLEVGLAENQLYSKHLKKIISLQDRDSRIKDKTINNLVQTMKRFYYSLKSNGLLTTNLNQDYNEAIDQVLGDKEIMWADENNQDTITREKLIQFSFLNNVSLAQPLDDNVKKRRESLTPILSRAKNFLNAIEDTKNDNQNQVPCTQIVSKGSSTPCMADNLTNQRNETIKFSFLNTDTLLSNNKMEAALSSSDKSNLEFDIKCMKRKFTFSPCREPIKHKGYELEDKNTVSADRIREVTPLRSVDNKTNCVVPMTQMSTPAKLPSTRNESNLLFVGGGTITKSKPTVLKEHLPVCKAKPIISVATSAAKENLKVFRRHVLSSTSDRKPSRLNQKPPFRSLAASHLVNASSTSKYLSKSTRLKPQTASSSQSRRALFRSKSASDLRG